MYWQRTMLILLTDILPKAYMAHWHDLNTHWLPLRVNLRSTPWTGSALAAKYWPTWLPTYHLNTHYHMYMLYILLLHYDMVSALNQHQHLANPYREPTTSVNCGLNIKWTGSKDQLCEAEKKHPCQWTFPQESVHSPWLTFALNIMDTTLPRRTIYCVIPFVQLFGSPSILQTNVLNRRTGESSAKKMNSISIW